MVGINIKVGDKYKNVSDDGTENEILDAVATENSKLLSKFLYNVKVNVDGDIVRADVSSITNITRNFTDMTVINYLMTSFKEVAKDIKNNKYICVKHDGTEVVLDTNNKTYKDESGIRRFSYSQGFWSISLNYGPKQANIGIYRLVAYFNEILTGKVRLSYDGLAVNHKRNDKFLKCEMLTSCNLEVTDGGSNSRHGHVWNKIERDCGIKTWFSAENKRFIDYIKSIDEVTKQHLESYGGFFMDGYWVVM